MSPGGVGFTGMFVRVDKLLRFRRDIANRKGNIT